MAFSHSPRVQTASILCKNKCGFYGNPSWDGYCSVCYRDEYLKHNVTRVHSSPSVSASTQAISKFEVKRKQITRKSASALKNIFRFSKEESRDRNVVFPEECYQAADELNKFLDGLRAVIGADVSRQISKFLEQLEVMAASHINQYSLAIQNFYQNTSKHISTSSLYNSLSEEMREALLNAIERFLTTWIYCWAFASPITDDEGVDLKLQEKIRSLHWVSPRLLDSPINPNSSEELSKLECATFSLIKMNTLFASDDKLEQIVLCCRSVFDALKVHYKNSAVKANKLCAESLAQRGNSSELIQLDTSDESDNTEATTANADDFLPTLIWLVIKANPPLLYSNLQFITRFANQDKLKSGEAGYFFTNLSCAVHFLKDLTPQSLHLSEAEFYRCIRSGLPLVRLPNAISEGEKQLTDNGVRLLELEDKLTNLTTRITSTERELDKFHEACQQNIEQMRTRWPMDTRVDDLDPRHLENPHVLLLGPLPAPTNASPNDSLLDSELGEAVNRRLADPIFPSQFSNKH